MGSDDLGNLQSLGKRLTREMLTHPEDTTMYQRGQLPGLH